MPEVPGLEFDEAGHIYRLDGIIIPSVSAVMAPLSKVKYDGINSRTLEKAAGKGTAVHNAIENWLKFDIEDVPPEHQVILMRSRSGGTSTSRKSLVRKSECATGS